MTVYAEEHDDLRAAVRGLLEKSADSAAVRATIAAGSHDAALWRRMSDELGLPGLAVAEDRGGAGFGVVELAVVCEEIGRATLPSPFLSTVLAGLALEVTGRSEVADALLPALASGDRLAALHVGDGADRSWQVAAGRVTGLLAAVPDALAADHLVLVSPGRSVVVDLDGPGVVRTRLETMDLTRVQTRVELTGAPARELPANEDAAARVAALAAVLVACEQIGGAERMVEMSAAYARERVQFGRPVGSFQAVKHLLADMLIACELARSTQQHAVAVAASPAAGRTALDAAARTARVACSRAFTQLTGDAIRVHGGIGYTWEHDAHLYFRRARASAALFGGVGADLDRLATHAGLPHHRPGDLVTAAPDLGAFRTRCAAWFAEHGRRPEAVPHRSRQPGDYVAAARRNQRALHEAGLAGITWPVEYGGLGLDPGFRRVFDEESTGYATFSDVFTIGLGMCGPVLLALGTEDQRRRYIPPMLSGDEVWCQLFSEPGAGSDLASLATAATPDGDGAWVVDGQKVWTTYAHHSDFGLLLARTDPDRPKHRGITMFVADMAARGVTTRPLRQATGDAEFNEVFLDAVPVTADDVVGAVDDGWRAATLMLANERVALSDSPIGSPVTLEKVVDLARRHGRGDDPVVRRAVGEAHVAQQEADLFARRIAAEVRVGNDPGPLASIGKLAAGRVAKQLAALALEIAGPAAVAWDPADPDGGLWAYGELYAPSLSIAGGTEQIQRTILGERVLGLPREPAADRDVPFRELRRSS